MSDDRVMIDRSLPNDLRPTGPHAPIPTSRDHAVHPDGIPRRTRLARLAAGIAGLVARLPAGSASASKRDQITAGLEAENSALRQRLAEQDAALDARDRAVALASHELRTPLNGILGMSDLLGQTPLTPDQASYVRTITHSATALVNLVDDMLDAGKMAAGHWRLRPRAFEVGAWIEEIVELLAPRAQAKGLELAAYVAGDVPGRIEADPEQLTRIVMNLAGNAIKFTERGGVSIEITAIPRQTSARLSIAVRDSGIGISPEDQARIFGEYEQAGTAPGVMSPGTGLGLSIARAIATAMSADLSLDSTPGAGTQFTLLLDATVVATPVGNDRSRVDRPFAGRRFLVVSAHMIEPSVLMRRLFDLGAVVDLASTAEAASDLLKSGEHFDAALIDESRDLAVADLLRLCVAGAVPAAILTTPADRGRLDHWRGAGAVAHFIKPIRTPTLRRILSRMIEGETSMTVPPFTATSSSPTEAVSGLAGPAIHRSGLRILLADDNEINTMLAVAMVEREGHTIECVENGARAIECTAAAAASATPFDVILMDLHMPVVDGFSAIRAIRDDARGLAAKPYIIALTADPTEATAALAREAGADLVLTKPVQAAHLAAHLQSPAVRLDAARDRGTFDLVSAQEVASAGT